nr:restriction endonuclease [uncultured Pseudomonas sp.]
MPRIDFKEIHSPNSEGGDADQFEKFCREFLAHILKFEILSDPCRGPDGGLDIKALDQYERKVLVSCKHYAHSRRSVGRNDEQDIIDRLHEHGCHTFYGFYSTIASSGLKSKLDRLQGLRKLTYELWDSEKIERYLLEGTKGFSLARRFFPVSVENLQPKIISLAETYQESDAVKQGDHWVIHLEGSGGRILSPSAKEAVKHANEMSMTEFLRPQFLRAWKDAVKLFPNFFSSPSSGIDSASSTRELAPAWSAQTHLATLKSMERWFVLVVWSFVDATRVRDILKSMNKDASQQSIDFMSISFHVATGTNRRDILARLLAYSPAG